MPFMAIMRSEGGAGAPAGGWLNPHEGRQGQLIILLRGTNSGTEWMLGRWCLLVGGGLVLGDFSAERHKPAD